MKERFQKMYIQEIALPESIKKRFLVVSCIAHSPKQQVYLVENKAKRRLVLKIAQGEKRVLLKKDAAILRKHKFSFFPEIYIYLEEQENSYLIREYIEGDTLWELINRKGPMGFREASEILCRICDMTEQLHQQDPPMIHRDLKPQNIVLTRENNLFLIDVGTIRTYEKNKNQDTVIVGTRPTAAPEQYGYRQTDERADIYALGVLYFFILTGSLNLEKGQNWKMIPRSAARIIRKCTRMDPADRYRNCRELKYAVLYRSSKKKPILMWRRKGT